MSKGNLFLGQARGRLGDIVFYHSAGVQVARARNRSPRNPKSVSQMLQRIVMNTVSKAYSAMQSICDHSFQGQPEGTACQSRFIKLNVVNLRDRLATVIADPTEEKALSSLAASFSFKDDYVPQCNDYIISEGKLPSQGVSASVNGNTVSVNLNFLDTIDKSAASVTYADVVQALGLRQGDQLTFIQVGHEYGRIGSFDDMDTFRFARIILEPNDGDMTKTFFGPDGPANPNSKNEGSFAAFEPIGEDIGSISFLLDGISSVAVSGFTVAGSAVIVSRFNQGVWERSSAQLVPSFSSGQYALNSATFGDAYASYLSNDSSGLFLNGSPT